MENTALDENVQFKGRTIFKQHIPKKHKWFGVKKKYVRLWVLHTTRLCI
jgi:hypothetical protein